VLELAVPIPQDDVLIAVGCNQGVAGGHWLPIPEDASVIALVHPVQPAASVPRPIVRCLVRRVQHFLQCCKEAAICDLDQAVLTRSPTHWSQRFAIPDELVLGARIRVLQADREAQS
jgi:hypothetical protein